MNLSENRGGRQCVTDRGVRDLGELVGGYIGPPCARASARVCDRGVEDLGELVGGYIGPKTEGRPPVCHGPGSAGSW